MFFLETWLVKKDIRLISSHIQKTMLSLVTLQKEKSIVKVSWTIPTFCVLMVFCLLMVLPLISSVLDNSTETSTLGSKQICLTIWCNILPLLMLLNFSYESYVSHMIVESLRRKIYVFFYVDDYSKYTSVEFIYEKTDTLDILKTFSHC